MTVEDLRELAEKEQARQAEFKYRILYCSSAGCVSSGCDAVKNELKKAIVDLDLSKKCEIIGTGCLGLCGEGPLVIVHPDMTLYQHVDAAAARRIIEEHVGQGRKLKDNELDLNDPFFASQKKIVLENMGKINAESIEELQQTVTKRLQKH